MKIIEFKYGMKEKTNTIRRTKKKRVNTTRMTISAESSKKTDKDKQEKINERGK